MVACLRITSTICLSQETCRKQAADSEADPFFQFATGTRTADRTAFVAHVEANRVRQCPDYGLPALDSDVACVISDNVMTGVLPTAASNQSTNQGKELMSFVRFNIQTEEREGSKETMDPEVFFLRDLCCLLFKNTASTSRGTWPAVTGVKPDCRKTNHRDTEGHRESATQPPRLHSCN